MRPQTIVERLDFVAKRIPGLKFTPPTQLKPGDDQFYGCFMSCDMFYIEIKVDQSHQSAKDVIISHGNSADGISCPVLRKVLADQDFETFAKHLSGLHSIYQISTNDKKVKQRAYPALTALESDLTILYDHQRRRIVDCNDLVHKSPIGVMEPRRGGLPVKLTYFITPYDLVDTNRRGLVNLNVNNIIDKNLGLSVTVEIEGSSQHKIQVKSLITQHNSSLPIYAPFNIQNSEKLPAQFVLKLSQPFPMLNTSINQINNEINEPATIKEYLNTLITNSKESIVTLIARQELDLNKGPFCRSVDILKGADSELCDLKKHVYSIKLPDQSHTYHILDNYFEKPEGVYVEKIPFTHPTSIPNILRVLRQQALFNFVIGSCIRRNKNSNASNNNNNNNNSGSHQSITDDCPSKSSQESNIFDVIPVSLNSVCISFEHPSKESLATLEIDFKELSCQLYALDKDSVCTDEIATKILQKCWSIPVTLRSVLKKCNERRLALLQDSSKRRERELQELLTNNSTTQQSLQFKSHLKYPDTSSLQSKFSNLEENKTNSRDLNSIAEFLSSKINNASTSDNNETNQPSTGPDDANSRSNLLKKFSCKPKIKQNTTAVKNQTGNKILSLMLKRQNSTSSVEDPNLKVPLAKKAKVRNVTGESSARHNATTNMTTTKLISPEVASAARSANKQSKQAGNNQNISLSLIRASNKSQIPTSVTSTSNASGSVNVALNQISSAPTTTKLIDPPPMITFSNMTNNIRAKANGGNNGPISNVLGGASKPRKSSIGAVLDKLVGGVTPEQQNNLLAAQQAATLDTESNNKFADPARSTPLSTNKTKSRPPGDQFAIKQGSSSGGLKLTVTKTKPSTASSSPSTTSILSSSGAASTTSSTSNTAGNMSSPSTTSTTNSSSIGSSATNNFANHNSNVKLEANKILDLGAQTPSIKYTIPKISKTQQASQSNASPADQANPSDPNSQQNDDNPSSSGNSSSMPSSTTTNKRFTSNPFQRAGNSSRSSVSSSTHPPNRTTSNPLASISGRPTSTSNNENLLNRISSSNQNQLQSPMRHQQQLNINRNVNLALPSQQLQQPQPQPQPPSLLQQPQAQIQPQMHPVQRINPSLVAQQQPLPNQASPMFALCLPNQQNAFPANSTDLNLIAANQAALLNQQQQLQQQQIQQQQQHLLQQQQLQQQQQLHQQQMQQQQMQQQQQLQHKIQQQHQQQQQQQHHQHHHQQQQIHLIQQSRVSSSSDSGAAANQGASIAQSNMPTSTPSSPTECRQADIIAPPPMIPIDSLDETQPTLDDVRDDASDRLSIVDTNENVADSLSAAGTPRSSNIDSPMNTQDSNHASSSSTLVARNIDPNTSGAAVASTSSAGMAEEASSFNPREHINLSNEVTAPQPPLPPPSSVSSNSNNNNNESNNAMLVTPQSPQPSAVSEATAGEIVQFD